MGRLAIPVNKLAVIYLTFVLVMSFFPVANIGLLINTILYRRGLM